MSEENVTEGSESYAEKVMAAVYQGAYTCPQCECTDHELDTTGEYDLVCGGCGWAFDLSKSERRRLGRPSPIVEA